MLAAIADVAAGLPAVCYLLAYGRLGLFVQVDGREGRSRRGLEDAADLQERALAAFAQDRLPPPGRLVVADSFVGVRRWRWTGDPPDGGLEGLAGALDWLADPVVRA
ncbi:MAG TPA: hypothetical protein VKV23_09585 [Acidimicrobiales bacterium]|nr:hypothetical protein [Acidimicrobiales bacterium]